MPPGGSALRPTGRDASRSDKPAGRRRSRSRGRERIAARDTAPAARGSLRGRPSPDPTRHVHPAGAPLLAASARDRRSARMAWRAPIGVDRKPRHRRRPALAQRVDEHWLRKISRAARRFRRFSARRLYSARVSDIFMPGIVPARRKGFVSGGIELPEPRQHQKSSRSAPPPRRVVIALGIHLDRLELAAGEARLLGERHGGVDAELGAHAAIGDAHIFVAARGRQHEDVLRRLHPRRQRIFHIGRIADVDVVVDHDHHVEVLQRAERRHDGVALQAVVRRPGLLHLHDGVEAVQAARRHLGVGDDRHRALQHLEQARLQHVLAQHHGLAAVAVDGVIDRLGPVRHAR